MRARIKRGLSGGRYSGSARRAGGKQSVCCVRSTLAANGTDTDVGALLEARPVNTVAGVRPISVSMVMNDIDDSEALVRKAMDGSGEWYTIRVGLAWDQLSINELRDRVIPAADLAERLSNVLGRPISRELFLEYCQQRPEDPKVVAAMARVLDVDALWLRAETAKPD